MNNELGHADPYQIDDNSPTLTFVAGDQILALPYHLVRAMHLCGDGRKIVIDYDEREVSVRGSALERLWKELRAFPRAGGFNQCRRGRESGWRQIGAGPGRSDRGR